MPSQDQALQPGAEGLLSEEGENMMVSQNLDSSGSSSRMEEEISEEEDNPMLSQEKDYSRRMEREERLSQECSSRMEVSQTQGSKGSFRIKKNSNI